MKKVITALEIQIAVSKAINKHSPAYPYLSALSWATGRALIPAKRLNSAQRKELENGVQAAKENHAYLN